MSIRKLIKLLDEHHITGAPVVDDSGRLIGIVSGKDIISAIDHLLQVFDSDPHNVDVHLKLREIYVHMGRYRDG